MAAGTSVSIPRQSTSSRSFTVFACGLFVLLGIVTTLLGPTLPLLATRWSIATAQAGRLFFWQFAASTIGTLASGFTLARRSFKIAILLGMALCVAGVGGLAVSNWEMAGAAVACFGFGLGVALPAINLAVAEANPEHRAASVSLLNFSWGIGAIGCPLLLWATYSLNIFLWLVTLVVGAGWMASCFYRVPDGDSSMIGIQATTLNRHTLTLAAILALLMFLFVGVENAVGGWASALALPQFSSAFTATFANVAFWGFFLGSRALAPLLSRVIKEQQLMRVGIIVAIIGVTCFYFANGAVLVILACGLAGLGIGPGFPVLISRVSVLLGSHNPAATICFAFAGLGGAALPPLVGLVNARAGQARAGLAIPFLALCALLPMSWRSRLERV